jgi:hypothetical protein
MRQPLSAFSQFNKRFAVRTGLGTVANAWLQYQYGIKPLVNSISSIAQGLKKPIGKRRITTRSSVTLNGFEDFTSSTVNVGSVWRMKWRSESSDTVLIRGMSLDEADIDVYFNVGLSAKGLITVPWELVRYSFVLDWFVNVGDFLNGIAPSPGFNQLGSSLSTKRTISTTYSIASVIIPPETGYTIQQRPDASWNVTSISRDRGPLNSPGVVVRADFGFKNIPRVLSALALGYQQFNNLWGTGSNFRKQFHK